MQNKFNRKIKDSLFTCLLTQKKYALQVYNVLNDSNYGDSDDIEITTLENVVFINIKNDVSFVLEDIFSLYEHQATYNPNMPLRSLFYMSNSYEHIINNRGANVYGSKLVKIPTPKCVVFYNGEEEYPDKMYLKLSDSFENQKVEGDIEIKVLMLNINYSHNQKLLESCEVLRGYSLYNEMFRKYTKEGIMTKEEAACKAIDDCIVQNVLVDFFRERRSEVVGMILEYTAEQAEKHFAKLEQEINEKEQRIEGLGQELTEKEQRIEGLGRVLTEKKERIEGLSQELSEKDRIITKLLEENTRLKEK